ncbi:unnamed protein product [Cuscuta campestris]|uniref:YDG domain-containing protein n=1 Tax=Cuscuta campestris TaxID=132261 RepID=A0A484NBJ6_9ASTE|nr:unnamed protein product [Cuscuta campestris]
MKEKPKKAAGEDEKKRSFRLDLKVLSKMKENNETIETPNSFGNIPGVEVMHQLFSRCEMTVIGFHNHWLNGIDYVGNSKAKEFKGYRLPLTRSIVLSGQYEDDQDNYDEVVYTGQGGNDLLGNKHQMKDQVMLRGNLRLKNCVA